MPSIHIPRGWELPEGGVTPESVFWNRRRFLKAMGFVGAGTFGLLQGCLPSQSDAGQEAARVPPDAPDRDLYPVRRNLRFTVNSRMTPEGIAARYNNFYEFTDRKDAVWRLAAKLRIKPWQVRIGGLVRKPQTYDVADLIRRMPLEERVYRHRCVEAWSMVVPWTGFPFSALIKHVEPLGSARYVKLVTFYRPDEAPGQRLNPDYPWPYTEGLTMAEAMNELTLLGTGIYGHPLPKQHGAPLRLIVPWKYGFKSIKSIVSIEFTDRQPETFWNTAVPNEYHFQANVDPQVPHPRWSQATERRIDTGERVPTLKYNGYGEFVAKLYE